MKQRNTVRARSLRRKQTHAEALLWSRLRNRQLANAKFRRQVPVGPYVADFLCVEFGLVVEADGGQHADRTAEDARRDTFFANQGYRTLRFWNNEIISNMDGVLAAILAELT
jgi:very-short-patch-repair endonuclease